MHEECIDIKYIKLNTETTIIFTKNLRNNV